MTEPKTLLAMVGAPQAPSTLADAALVMIDCQNEYVDGLLPLTGWLASVPLVGSLGSGEGAEIRAPMAIAVITGLVSSTLLTLVVIPSVYALVARRGALETEEAVA